MKSKLLLKVISIAGLVVTIAPSFFVFNNNISLAEGKTLMFLGTAVWFIVAPFWMNRGNNT